MGSELSTRVQGIVLDMSSDSFVNFGLQVANLKNSNLNLWKNINIHLSLTLFSFSDINECKKIIPILEDFTKNISQIEVSIGSPEALDKDFISVPVISKELNHIHESLLELIQPYLEGHYNPKYLNYEISTKQKEYLHKYGYHRVKEFFKPHITIARYSSKEIRDQQLKLISEITGKFNFTRIYMDDCIDGSGIPAQILWSKELN